MIEARELTCMAVASKPQNCSRTGSSVVGCAIALTLGAGPAAPASLAVVITCRVAYQGLFPEVP